jgi:hypothetical protein
MAVLRDGEWLEVVPAGAAPGDEAASPRATFVMAKM